MSCMTLSSQQNHLFLLFSYFRAHPTTLVLKILGGQMNGPRFPLLRQTHMLEPDRPVSPEVGQNQEAQKLNAYLILLQNIDQDFERLRTLCKLNSCFQICLVK